ncbi:leucine carboxyl methyltransferase 1-like [Mizuhopecten yessoensis]|uniref:Leucine carboxyl methyltransferase 1 n=1 Tax=Mizuhopecten yessoensis TaxID=6573 RepID=A0A210R1Q7_MIZYE|nr:leucine carboxyl methyltransferase 1-like [Mizuhopecten yessoensis]OWF54825.1 Leucine carboxyl methyltransferase 1 [Mizuhopecten yessoensis]
MANEDAVRATNDDAAQCKRFAVERGYWEDPYISLLTTKGQARHAPEINRGYYARVSAMRTCIQRFIKLTDCKCQIINLGAGFDTTYWLLKDQQLSPKNYVEVDFAMVTSRKCHQIRRNEMLLKSIAGEDGEVKMSKTEIHATDYHLVSANLRSLEEVKGKLTESGIDTALPTLFVTECVLVYVDTESTNKVLKWIADSFPVALFLNYEQVNMTDRFGQVMIDNLKTRDCVLMGVEACTSMDSQKHRFTSQGWQGADGMDMSQIYKCLPDIHRIEHIEFMDEKELLDQLLSHYCIVWAWKDPHDLGLCDMTFT